MNPHATRCSGVGKVTGVGVFERETAGTDLPENERQVVKLRIANRTDCAVKNSASRYAGKIVIDANRTPS
jgi:hypothetical protein